MILTEDLVVIVSIIWLYVAERAPVQAFSKFSKNLSNSLKTPFLNNNFHQQITHLRFYTSIQSLLKLKILFSGSQHVLDSENPLRTFATFFADFSLFGENLKNYQLL